MQRGVALSGPEALAWLAERQVAVREPAERIRVFADSIQSPEIGIARVWTSGLDARFDAADRAAVALTLIEGAFTVTAGERTDVLRTGESLLLPPSSTVALASTSAAAWIEVRVERTRWLSTTLPPQERTITPLAPSDVSRILTGLVNSLLASELTGANAGWAHIERAVEETLLALLGERAGLAEAARASSAEEELFRRTMATLHAHANDPTFTVTELVSRLNSSTTRVGHAFTVHGTTARRELRATRAALARELLSRRRVTSREEMERIARRSGFRTVETMRATIRATGS
ncbi:hypothetical protein [Rathayibacter tanaceti]|uniref:HTH araC/xylS-type domain-containing protein n=2 Tax=Rathayibacter tanaceti TaxID=1671680 RepID=A0A166HXU7_9MICO|nr:hypothetical protein [Rathayibacter tanaceti]KZX21322.1 hypothetical protein ACH61_01555 [Rathayibacter tanaceti]QHC54285.1 hypothetical protein GSU10_00495 [Rathayibacter tanaceti]TCO37963.1 hypothetical protein EV639_103150 [Rathayibacter tanaceti]